MKWLFLLWDILLKAYQTPKMPPPVILPPEPIEPPNLVFIRQAEAWLGRDASPLDKAPDTLGCAESVSNIIRTIIPSFPYTVSTIRLYEALKESRRFKGTLTPSKGCIVVSPRIGDQPGHCGIFISDDRIASNNSQRGIWEDNYTWDSWIKYFKGKGLRIHLFEPI